METLSLQRTKYSFDIDRLTRSLIQLRVTLGLVSESIERAKLMEDHAAIVRLSLDLDEGIELKEIGEQQLEQWRKLHEIEIEVGNFYTPNEPTDQTIKNKLIGGIVFSLLRRTRN